MKFKKRLGKIKLQSITVCDVSLKLGVLCTPFEFCFSKRNDINIARISSVEFRLCSEEPKKSKRHTKLSVCRFHANPSTTLFALFGRRDSMSLWAPAGRDDGAPVAGHTSRDGRSLFAVWIYLAENQQFLFFRLDCNVQWSHQSTLFMNISNRLALPLVSGHLF